MDHRDTTRPARNVAVDFLRASGVILIVLGHWLASSVTYHDGRFGRQNPLVDQPWTQWLTWGFQAVPTFFMVAGYATAVSWAHRRDDEGFSRQNWLRHRLARVLGPTAVYVAVILTVVAVLRMTGQAGSVVQYAGWAVAMQLWFLAVYVVVVSSTPIALAAQRRWGLWAAVALAAAAVLVDAATMTYHVPHLGLLNYLFCWGAFYQLGIAWQAGQLAGLRPVLLAAGSGTVLALLVWRGHYPVSMIGVPGQQVQNTTPPTVALLAFGCTQIGIGTALVPALNRALRPSRARRVVSVVNNNVMALYLWHMVPVVLVAVVGYPAGLFPQPAEGTADWWLFRLEWIGILIVVTGAEITVLFWGRRFFAAALPALNVPIPERWAEPVLLVGATMTTYALACFAADGFAPDGRFPWLRALVFAFGAALVAVRARRPLHQ
ncbi:acyltransferase family protein [Mycobacterium sp. Z3061]|uniref:acyltransferase family protein n=1 Tax=Mycobacterium sp. Z3061 TaxID=3073562 RepID=UPI00287307D9|nr:acyltransferase [Mycobacterium sp. Z3061]